MSKFEYTYDINTMKKFHNSIMECKSNCGVEYYTGHKKVFAHNGRSGTISLMCPRCYNIYEVALAVMEAATAISTNDLHIDDIFLGYSIYCKCPSCKTEDLFIELDTNIAKAISIFNKKGYKTLYCCEGHKYTENYYDYIASYIYFKDRSILEYIDYLPETWFLDYTNIMDSGDIIIRSESFHCFDEAMMDILQFAINLPTNAIVDTTKNNL